VRFTRSSPDESPSKSANGLEDPRRDLDQYRATRPRLELAFPGGEAIRDRVDQRLHVSLRELMNLERDHKILAWEICELASEELLNCCELRFGASDGVHLLILVCMPEVPAKTCRIVATILMS
jgi:hypothetical protein